MAITPWQWADYRYTLAELRNAREAFTRAMQHLPPDVRAGGPGSTVLPDHLNAWTDYLYRAWDTRLHAHEATSDES